MEGLSPALSVQKGMTLSRAHDAAGGFDSLREAYEEVGVDGYYADHGAAYRNPHEPILIEALCLAFSKLEEAGLIDASTRPLRVLDYACGSGEGHLAIINWVDGRSERLAASVTAADPYTYMSYEKRMGYPCQRWSFEDISGGVLEEHPPFDVVVGAFCLHLIDKSFLRTTLMALARACDVLVVASPHKRPHIDADHGWEEATSELLHHRIHIRCFTSLQRPRPDAAVMAAAAARAATAKHRAAEEAAANAVTHGLYPPLSVTQRGHADKAGDDEEEQGAAVDTAVAAAEDEEIEAALAEITAEIEVLNLGALRAALAEGGLDTTGKKAQLAERLREARVKAVLEAAQQGLDGAAS